MDHNIDVMPVHDHNRPWINISVIIFVARAARRSTPDSYCTAVTFGFLGSVTRKVSDPSALADGFLSSDLYHA